IAADHLSELDIPLKIVEPDLAWSRVVRKREKVTDTQTTEVVEAKLKDAKKALYVGGRIERIGPFGDYRLYNVDIPPAQSYLYENDIFPLADCEVTQSGDRLNWDLKDDVWAYDYVVPDLTEVKLDIEIEKEGKLPRYTDPMKSITLGTANGDIEIGGMTEEDKLLGLVDAVEKTDPDFILTKDGDTFLFPYLVKRAEAIGLGHKLKLDRDNTTLRSPAKNGTSYFSYGRIHYKPSAMKLFGRLHIDINTSFAYSEAGFEGLFELS